MNAPSRPVEAAALAAYADTAWDQRIVPALTDYIAVPAKSPMFDAAWAEHGLIDRVVRDAAAWVESRQVAGLKLEVLRLEGRTPVIFFDIPATKAGSSDTVLLYGHLDKQPEFNGWRKDLGPWTPKYENGCSTAAAVPTTVTRCMPPSPPSKRWISKASAARAAWA
jgi:acetylornithine deacetylase/succinyl-diaminopimelate desuccinylase-like protein